MSVPLPTEIAKAEPLNSAAATVGSPECPTVCPKCGADLTETASPIEPSAASMNNSMSMPAAAAAAPAKKGLLGLGFLGLGGRRRRTAHRRRRTAVHHRRNRKNTRRGRRAH